MAVHTVVVRAAGLESTTRNPHHRSTRFTHWVMMIAVAVAMAGPLHNQMLSLLVWHSVSGYHLIFVSSMAGVYVALWMLWSKPSKSLAENVSTGVNRTNSVPSWEWTVEMSQVGIQLHRPKNSCRKQSLSLFVARSDIIDCIVQEVIHVDAIHSLVSLRVVAPDGRSMTETSTTRPSFRLIPLFPGVRLTYQECLVLRNEIQQRLETPR
jgi:disulfide bond formation protein DsbB